MDNGGARPAPVTVGELAAQLRALRLRAGSPSFAEIKRRVGGVRTGRGLPENEAQIGRSTIYDCFRENRKRLDPELVLDIVRALGADNAEVVRWKASVLAVQRRADAAAAVWVDDTIPDGDDTFVGRERELSAITAEAGAYWISGMPGIGKSQLAYRAARTFIGRTREVGVLIADLRGFSAEGPPVDPDAVVTAFLRVLGIPPRQQPSTPQNRVTALTAALRDRPHLLILDDAADMSQVRRIVTAAPESPTLVTSRSRPAARSLGGFTVIPLEVFTPDESLSVLAARVGADRATSEAEARALLATTGHLPLAVSLVASQVAARPNWSLTDIAGVARSRHRALRLDEALAQTFSMSYQALSGDAQAMLRLLSAVPVTQFDRTAAVALGQGLVDDSDEALATLLRQHLITRSAPGRFTVHQLLRLHAADVSVDEDPPVWRREARVRLVEDLAARAWRAYHAQTVSSAEVPRAPRGAADGELSAAVTGDDFFATFGELMLSLAHSEEISAERPTAVIAFSETIGPWLHLAERFEDALALHTKGLELAEALDDAEGRIRARTDIGMRLAALGRFSEAERHLREELPFASDYPREAVSLHNTLGIAADARGKMDEAAEHYRKAVEIADQLGDLRRSSHAQNNLAGVYLRTDRLIECEAALSKSAELAEQIGDASSAARSLANLASLAIERGDAERAASAARGAAERFESLGQRVGVVYSCSNLGAALLLDDRPVEALAWLQKGLENCADGSFPQHASLLHARLSKCHLVLGDQAAAQSNADTALRLADEVGDQHAKSAALVSLAESRLAAEDVKGARERWQHALKIVEGIGDGTWASQLRERLAQHPA